MHREEGACNLAVEASDPSQESTWHSEGAFLEDRASAAYKGQACMRQEDQGVAYLASCVVPGNHREDKHKHNHVQLRPELLNLPRKRVAAWEEGQEEPYGLGVERADVEEQGTTACIACRSMAITSQLVRRRQPCCV